MILATVVGILLTMAFRAKLAEGDGTMTKKLGPLGLFLHGFNFAVERVTDLYAAILGRIVTRRLLTILFISGFCVGIFVVNEVLPSGFIPLEDQGIIYGIIQTPPGSTLEYTNSKAKELQAICKGFDEITSVSSLAGYEVLTEVADRMRELALSI